MFMLFSENSNIQRAFFLQHRSRLFMMFVQEMQDARSPHKLRAEFYVLEVDGHCRARDLRFV